MIDTDELKEFFEEAQGRARSEVIEDLVVSFSERLDKIENMVLGTQIVAGAILGLLIAVLLVL